MTTETKLPVDRHFDCMKRCPMDCGKVCKRLAYPKLVATVKAFISSTEESMGWGCEDARALLRSLGEAE